MCDQNQYQQGVKIKMSANPVNHLTVTHQNHCHAIPLNPLSRESNIEFYCPKYCYYLRTHVISEPFF